MTNTHDDREIDWDKDLFGVEEFLRELEEGKFESIQRPDLFPSYQSIGKALLCLIYFRGGELYSGDAYGPLSNYFNLSERAKAISRSEYFGGEHHAQSAWHCLVQWARRDLKKHDLLDPKAPRGVWKLTESGMQQAAIISAKYTKLDV
jgi:hypothetical protein